MASWLSGRRGFLKVSSIFPISIAATSAASAAADDAEFCADVPKHPAVPAGDPQYDEVSALLWSEFVEGTRAGGETPTISTGTENSIKAQQGAQLKRKVRFWDLCKDETTNCAYSAGIIADGARRAEGGDEIEMKHFNIGKDAVKAIQKKRLGRAVVGIAC